MAQAHAVLEGALVVGLGALRLDVLLDRVDLGLVLDQLLLDVIQSVVDVALQYLVFLRIMLHRVVSHLLLQPRLVLGEEGADLSETHLFPIEVDLEVVGASELVGHLVLHLPDLLSHLLHLLLNAALEGLDLLEIVLALLQLDLESSVGGLRVFHLALLEGELFFLIFVLCCCWQVVLPHHGLLHVLKQKSDCCLMIVDLTLVLGLFLFETLHEIVDLTLLLVEDLVLLSLTVLSSSTLTPARLLLLKILLDLLDVALVGLDHLADIGDILLELFDLSVVLLDSVEEAFTGLGEGQVHLVGLQFEVVLPLDECGLLLLQVLCSLL